jgi:hypothetical protein
VWVPLVDTSERLGVLETTCSSWSDDTRAILDPIVRILVLVLISTRRYTDVGHGMSSVLLSVAAINCWRNARREGARLATAYADTSDVIATQFGNSRFVTGQLGRLMLACAPSLPMGLGGSVNEIATETLQPGDRVLFFSDGVVETRSPDGEQFGVERLADFLVRATLDQVFPAETRRCVASRR